MKIVTYLSTCLLLLSACSKEAKPIQYGFASCAYCVMQISDQRYGAEIVTVKGKVYVFDSIECMIDMTREGKLEREKVLQHYLTDFNNPNVLVPADGMYILKSKYLPSPMARNLTAFSSVGLAEVYVDHEDGKIRPWNEALEEF